jgi:LPXTG-site transpeptidase (sortase) family protein
MHRAVDHRGRITTWLIVLSLALVVAGAVLPAGPLPKSEQQDPAPIISRGTDALFVPSIGLSAPIVPIALDAAGVLTPPADTHMVGWWKQSAEPGAGEGQTVVTGHTVHAGGGVMNRLGEVEAGDVVRIRDEGHVVDYRATKVFVYSKADLAAHAHDLFTQTRRGGRLVLVTCTDWVDGIYLSNIIVFAAPL